MKDIMLITGASSGLGLALAKCAIRSGLSVHGIATNEEKLKKCKTALGEDFTYSVCDISDQKAVSRIVASVAQKGNLRYLINNAQRAVFRAVTDYSEEDAETSLKGLKGMIFCTQEVLKAKQEADVTVVNIGSSASFTGKGNEALYCAVKWGVRGYTEALQDHYKGSSVKIIGAYPSGMDTPFWENSRDYMPAEKTSRFMSPESVAEVILHNILAESVTVTELRISRN